jgi:hypothetical protein
MALRDCPDCGTQVSARAMSCPSCGRALKRPARRFGCLGSVLIVGGVLLGGMCLISALTGRRPAPTRPGSPQPTPKAVVEPSAPRPAIPPTPSLHIGDEAILSLPGAQAIFLASAEDEEAYDELIDAENASDIEGIARMMARGRAFRVPNGTRVKVIGSSFSSRKVRILEGPYLGEAGWVQADFVVAP